MFSLKIGDKEYPVKFSYRPVTKLHVLNVVNSLNVGDNEDTVAIAEKVFDALPTILLAGLIKKNEEEFGFNYDSVTEFNKKINQVTDLLDDYFDQDECEYGVMDIFGELTKELTENGFLFKKAKEAEKALAEVDATVTPQDHKKAQN